MEKAGVLEHVSHSQRAFPIVPVPKKDGQIHICGDFKITVDSVLQVDQYPLLKPEDLFVTASDQCLKFPIQPWPPYIASCNHFHTDNARMALV